MMLFWVRGSCRWRVEKMNAFDTREKLATAIEAYLDGKIDNSVLDSILSEKDVQSDNTCMEIANEMMFFLSDFRRHKNEGKYRICEEVEHGIRRWVYLLRTGWEWPSGRKDSTLFGLRGLLDLLRSNLCTKSRLDGNLYWPLAGPKEWSDWKAKAAQ
jgi:hypothetical protein